MQVTAIEVIRRDPVALGVPVEVPTGEHIEVTYGDTLRVSVSLEYRGNGHTVTLYGAIGSRGWAGFDEIVHGRADLTLPDTPESWSPITASVDILIGESIDAGTDYDLYCKIEEYPDAGMPEVDDVIDVVGIPPTYELIQETIYPYSYVYDGDIETSSLECKTDPITPASWSAEQMAAAVKSEVEDRGGHVLELRVWADTSPLLWTEFKVEVVSTPLTGVGTLAIPIWAAILIAAFGIAFLVAVITWSVQTIVGTFEHKPLSEDIKLAWSRETLIQVIGDFEEKLERIPTPAEELEQMSDQELRDYCNELAEQVAPPEGVSWWPIALGAGVAVIGIGTVMATRKKE